MHINVTAPIGQTAQLEALEGFRIMEIIRDWAEVSGIGIRAECGGACACATCHVHVAENWLSELPEMQEEEEDRLDEVFAVSDESRLSCQLIMTPELDGLHVTLSADSFLPVRIDTAA